MTGPNGKALRGVFSALVIAALGLGVSQALASPAPAGYTEWICSATEESDCQQRCQYMNANGRCMVYDGVVNCTCEYW
jgi:hypothetical protein